MQHHQDEGKPTPSAERVPAPLRLRPSAWPRRYSGRWIALQSTAVVVTVFVASAVAHLSVLASAGLGAAAAVVFEVIETASARFQERIRK